MFDSLVSQNLLLIGCLCFFFVWLLVIPCGQFCGSGVCCCLFNSGSCYVLCCLCSS